MSHENVKDHYCLCETTVLSRALSTIFFEVLLISLKSELAFSALRKNNPFVLWLVISMFLWLPVSERFFSTPVPVALVFCIAVLHNIV